MNNVEELPTGAIRARAMRRARANRLLRKALIFVGLPTLLACCYYGAWASDQYQSSGVFTVEAADDKMAQFGISMLLGGLPSSGTGRDVRLVQRYITSRAMLEHLIAQHGWRDHVTDHAYDWWSRLSDNADSEEVYEDYVDRVTVQHDTQTNALTLHVRAYSADIAQAISRAILAASEDMVNQMSERLRRDQIRFAEQEVEQAERRYAGALQALIELQGQGVELDPMSSASALLQLRTELEAELAKAQAEFDAARVAMRPNAPKVVALRQRVLSLTRQIEAQRRRLVDGADNDGLNEQIARFEPAMMEKEFAQKALQSAIASLEVARIEAARQHRYLVTISAPSQPDAPTHPRRWWSILTVFVLAVLGASIGNILIAAVREHAKL
ncbi:hypothetical protein [Haliangium sp.]|uniref:hypothetical protein n=1 Tax=Haliangium sp. TaxID=2663208 RepID=UPI003D11DACD